VSAAALHVVSTKAFLAALSYGNGSHRMPALMLGVSTLLAATPGRIVSTDQLIDWLYGEDPDGGPLDARCCIAVAVHHLRRRGVPIRSHGHRGYSYEPAA